MTYPHSDMPESQTRGPVTGRDGTGGVSWSWVLVAVLAIAIVLLVGWWLWQGASPASETRSASLGTILEQPESFADDDRVVVSGQVERLLTENAMTLGNDFVESELLVLTPPGAFVGPGGGAVAPGVAVPAGGDGTVAPFLEGQFVQVTGSVRTFDAEALTEDYGLVLAPELFDPFEGQPAIITEVFDIAINAPQLAPPVEEEEVDVAAVLAEPERFAGQTVRLEGGFGEVISDNIFTLTGPNGEDGLLVAGEDTGGFDEMERGRPVRVEGTVLGFDAEALRDAGVEVGDDIDAASLEGRITIIPTAVDVLDEPEGAASPAANGTTEEEEAAPAVATPQAS